MIGLVEFKKALGSIAETLSEKEILELRELQDKEAELYFNMWIEHIRSTENEV